MGQMLWGMGEVPRGLALGLFTTRTHQEAVGTLWVPQERESLSDRTFVEGSITEPLLCCLRTSVRRKLLWYHRKFLCSSRKPGLYHLAAHKVELSAQERACVCTKVPLSEDATSSSNPKCL